MILDALLQLSSAQAVTTSAVSTNTVDLGSNRDLGPGRSLYAVFAVDQTAAASGAATVNFQIISSPNSDLSSASVLNQSDAISKTELTAGRKPFALRIDPAILSTQPNGQRYLGVNYAVGTGPLTAGKFSSYFTDSLPPGMEYYPSGFTVA